MPASFIHLHTHSAYSLAEGAMQVKNLVKLCAKEYMPAVAITDSVDIPVIGIGASAHCDGQVLVTEDMLGMFERTARFVRRYEGLAETISGAAERYAADVRARSFPGEEQVYRPKK